MLALCFQFEASILTLDDFLDNSGIRNQQLCWYRHPNVGKKAGIHAIFMENCLYYLLHKYFSSHPQYQNILNTFITSIFYSNYSQCLDVCQYNEKNLNTDYLNALYLGKAEYGLYYTCITIAMYLAYIQNPELHDTMKKILLAMGYSFQIQVS